MSGLNAERVVTRAEAAEYLREFADKLAAGGHGETTQTTGQTASGTTTTGSTTGDTTTDTARHGSTDETTPSTRDQTTQGSTDQATQQSGETQRSTETGDGHHTSQYGKVTFLVGNDSATVNPPEEVSLNVDVGEDSSMMSSGAETVTFSLHWDKEAVPESDELRIE